MHFLRGRTSVSSTLLGAIIVLLLLAYDAFVQQVLTYPVDFVLTDNDYATVMQAFASPFTWPMTAVASFEEAIKIGI